MATESSSPSAERLFIAFTLAQDGPLDLTALQHRHPEHAAAFARLYERLQRSLHGASASASRGSAEGLEDSVAMGGRTSLADAC